MWPYVQSRTQAMVIMGFALTALASVIDYFFTITQRGYEFGTFNQIVIPILNPLIMIAALIAWCWLTQLEAGDDRGGTILRWAFLAFAAEYLITAFLYFLVFMPLGTQNGFWLTSSVWLEMVGALVTSVGIFLLARPFSPRTKSESETIDVGVVDVTSAAHGITE